MPRLLKRTCPGPGRMVKRNSSACRYNQSTDEVREQKQSFGLRIRQLRVSAKFSLRATFRGPVISGREHSTSNAMMSPSLSAID